MSNTYLALCQKFRKLVGISGSGPSTVTGQTGMNEKITLWIADADMFIQKKWEDWSFLLEPKTIITATAGIATFTLADLSITDLGKWRKTSFVRDPGSDDYLKLAYDLAYLDYIGSDMYLGAADTGAIERVIIRDSDDAVIFYPTPTANTTIWAAYYKMPTRITVDTSTSPIPTRFEDVILYRAKMYYAEHYEDVALYRAAVSDYEKELVKLESRFAPAFRGTQATGDDDGPLDVRVE